MNEQELRELLAEQAAVIHELKRDAEGMSAIIADLRARLRGGKMICANGSYEPVDGERLIKEILALTCDRHSLPACSACTRDFPEHYQKLLFDACQRRNHEEEDQEEERA